MPRNEGLLTIEDATIIYRNFSGKEGQYNAKGDMNFCVVLEPDIATRLRADGWNVKTREPREEGDEAFDYIKVTVSYNPKARPPKVVLITHKGKTDLTEDMVSMLDWVEIDTVDLIISPYSWTIRGESGISAYLRTMYMTIVESPLDLKYADVEYADQRFEPKPDFDEV
jgi:hypothetical protein